MNSKMEIRSNSSLGCRPAFLIALSLFVIAGLMPTDVAAQQRTKRSDPNTYYRAAHSMSGKTIILPIGTTFEGRMSTSISSAQSHAGQAFAIILSSPLLANGTDVVIPAGSEVIGEVVEAIPSRAFPRKKKMPPTRGKLRIQLNQLRTPDGTSYPLVASLAGEVEDTKGGRGRTGPQLGSNVAYVGSAAAFEAVAPGANRYGGGRGGQQGRGPEYVRKREFMSHEIYGTGGDRNQGDDDNRIRSLVVRKYDYWIDEGSPLTVRTGAPLKLGIAAPGAGVPLGNVDDEPDESLPGRSLKNAGSDIPPIGGENFPAPSSASPPSNTMQAPVQAPAQTPAASGAGKSPSSDF